MECHAIEVRHDLVNRCRRGSRSSKLSAQEHTYRLRGSQRGEANTQKIAPLGVTG